MNNICPCTFNDRYYYYPLTKNQYMQLTLIKKDNNLMITADGVGGHLTFIPNFCPLCGRKIHFNKEEDDK